MNMETPYDILRQRVADIQKLILIKSVTTENTRTEILDKLRGAMERKIGGMIWIMENFPNNPYDVVDLDMVQKLVVLTNGMEKTDPGYDDLAKLIGLLLDRVSPNQNDRNVYREERMSEEE